MREVSDTGEQVDFDEDNYIEEEMDDDVEERTGSDVEDVAEVEYSEEEEENEDGNRLDSPKDRLLEAEGTQTDTELADSEIKANPNFDDPDFQKYSELLSLPPHGSEIFVGGLLKDVSEEALRDCCETYGEIYEIRLVKNKETGESKGYAFISFTSKSAAQKAIEDLHNKVFEGKTLRCSLSESKYRLFIGNVPKALTEDQFRKIIEETGPGSENIELIKDPQNPSRNRGFAFVEYYNNACADYSRKKMSSGSFKLEGNTPTVTWADPKNTPSSSSAAAAQVKALYVKNIPDNTTTDQLKEVFQRHGEVTKVVMPPSKSGSAKRDFGFVHFAERSSALKAVSNTEIHEIDGQKLEVALAKPQADKKLDGSLPHSAIHSYAPPQVGFSGFAANLYGSVGVGYGLAPAMQSPMIYGRGPMPSGMQMVPMVLPDGRIGYVLQQPGMQIPAAPRPRRHDRGTGPGGGSHGGRVGGSENANRSRRYQPY
uniref:RRM domain-containing protein n=1 Tax=Kalanchoe fedtschenkoi TaxID=63787 RepID=A0A7N1A3D9_KALFE